MSGLISNDYLTNVINYAINNHNIQNTAVGVFKQSAYAAIGAGIGGIVGGRLAALIGTAVGAVVGYNKSEDYDGLISILQKMTNEEKEVLKNEIYKLVGSADFLDFQRWFQNVDHQQIFMQSMALLAKLPINLS